MIVLREINKKIEPCYCDGDDDDDNKSLYCSAASSSNIGWETYKHIILGLEYIHLWNNSFHGHTAIQQIWCAHNMQIWK